MPEPVNLSAVFGLPPEKAIEYFQAKGYDITWNWHDSWQQAQARSFTVAKAMRLDILETIRHEVDRTLEEGITLADFRRNLTPRLQALGWWGKQIIVDGEGNAQVAHLGSPRRLETIFRTNTQTAYMAGRYREMMENVQFRPWWQYVAVMDGKTRPSHSALNGRVFRHDDPFWQYYYPPNGFNCRCRVRALSDRNLKDRDIQPSSSKGFLGETWAIDKKTGFTERVATLKLPGMDKAFSPDLGWSYNPGEAAFGNDVAVMRKISAVKDRGLRVQAVQSLNNSDLRQEAFASWVENALANKTRAMGSAQTLGIMDEVVADFVRSKGVEPARVIVMTDRSLLHADRGKHLGATLTAEEYQSLPALLANPEAVLWDAQHENLLFIGPSSTDGRKNKVIVSLAYTLRKKGVVDEIINAYKVGENALGDVNSYEVIQGELKRP